MKTNSDYNKYLKSAYWNEIKEQVLERDKHRCRLCDSSDNLQVHHRTYDNLHNEDLEELITLCKKCHYIVHKTNPQLQYSMYLDSKKWEEAYHEKEVVRKFILLNYSDTLNTLKQRLKENTYIKTSEFEKVIKRINKYFNYELFINLCLNYINGVSINSWDKELNTKYNLPDRSIKIILDKDIFDLEPHEFSMYAFIDNRFN